MLLLKGNIGFIFGQAKLIIIQFVYSHGSVQCHNLSRFSKRISSQGQVLGEIMISLNV